MTDQTVRVPVTPTMDMILAGSKTICAEMPEDYFAAKNAWAAMIAAAPSPEAEGAGEREVIARIIDPDAWYLWDTRPTFLPSSRLGSLSKADAILASLQRPQTTAPDSGLVEDAERFRALMRCGRIKMQGSSGVDPHTGERNGNNVHFGAEFWPEPIEPEWEDTYRAGTTWGRACIKALADAILEQEALAQARNGAA